MNKWCAIAVVAISAFAASAQAEVIVRFIVDIDTDAKSFNIFVEDLAPVATMSGQLGNGGIAGFSISFDQKINTRSSILIESLELGRLSGQVFVPGQGFVDTGFELDSTSDGHDLDPNDPGMDAPNMFAIQRDSLTLYQFGQIAGAIDNDNFGAFPNDGPIPFGRPALVGSGTFSSALSASEIVAQFPVTSIGATVFSFVGASVSGDNVADLTGDELELVINSNVIPEPASLAMLAVGAGLVFTGRKRETL